MNKISFTRYLRFSSNCVAFSNFSSYTRIVQVGTMCLKNVRGMFTKKTPWPPEQFPPCCLVGGDKTRQKLKRDLAPQAKVLPPSPCTAWSSGGGVTCRWGDIRGRWQVVGWHVRGGDIHVGVIYTSVGSGDTSLGGATSWLLTWLVMVGGGKCQAGGGQTRAKVSSLLKHRLVEVWILRTFFSEPPGEVSSLFSN